MASSESTTIFFGPTSGCLIHTLALSLRSSHPCRALARSPEKLVSTLSHTLPKSTIDKYLTIIHGDISSLDAIVETLTCDGGRVDTVISGIGGTPQLGNSIFTPMTIPDPHICETGVRNILAALERTGTKPLLCVISSRGVSEVRDYPLSMSIFYRWILNGTLPDKRAMESLIHSESSRPASQRVTIATCIVRPSHLNDGPAQGMEKIRVGDTQNPVNGYSINREDVGLWIYEKVVKRDRSLDGKGRSPEGAWGITY